MDGKIFNASKYFLLVTLITFLYSCSNNSNNIAAFKALDESLVNSNITIRKSTEIIHKSILDKLADPTTAYKAEIWFPKAMKVKDLSSTLIDYIEKLKLQTVKEKKLTNEKAIDLFKKLLGYRNSILQIDPEVTAVFDTTIVVITKTIDSGKINSKEFVEIFFNNSSVEMTLSSLSKFENNIRIIENRMIQFCNYKIPEHERFYEFYSVIVSQNASYIKAGERIEIIAGVGAFSLKAKPVIMVNGKNIPPEVDGAAYYKFRAPNKPGKNYVPVAISFTDEFGKKQTISKTVEYTVMQ